MNDLFNNYFVFIEKMGEIKALLVKKDVKGYAPLKRFSNMLTDLDNGEQQGVLTIGKNLLLHHYKPLISQNMSTVSEKYVSGVLSGFIRRMAGTIENKRLGYYAGFLNVLMGSLVPHTFSIELYLDLVCNIFP